MKKILHLTLFLALVSAVAGGALATANMITAPRIEENKIAVEKENLEKLYPGKTFSAVDVAGASKEIVGIFEVSGEGYVYKMEVSGYKANITFLVGIDATGNINGYAVLSHEETSGIGSKIAEDKFIGDLVGNAVNTEFDAIGGATVSSKAVINGIAIAAEHWGANFGELGEGGAPAPKPFGTILAISANDDGTTSFEVSAEGFYGPNTFEIIIDDANVITSFKVLEQNETPGIGDDIVLSSFTSQFIGKEISVDFEGDAISGATLSSKSAFDAIKEVANSVLGN